MWYSGPKSKARSEKHRRSKIFDENCPTSAAKPHHTARRLHYMKDSIESKVAAGGIATTTASSQGSLPLATSSQWNTLHATSAASPQHTSACKVKLSPQRLDAIRAKSTRSHKKSANWWNYEIPYSVFVYAACFCALIGAVEFSVRQFRLEHALSSAHAQNAGAVPAPTSASALPAVPSPAAKPVAIQMIGSYMDRSKRAYTAALDMVRVFAQCHTCCPALLTFLCPGLCACRALHGAMCQRTAKQCVAPFATVQGRCTKAHV